MTEVGGSIRGVEVGGGSFMRGYRSRRFADSQKMLYSGELRRTLRSMRWRGHYFETLGMLYVDAGRVGYRATWNSQLSIRTDIAVSPEGRVVLLSFGNLF